MVRHDATSAGKAKRTVCLAELGGSEPVHARNDMRASASQAVVLFKTIGDSSNKRIGLAHPSVPPQKS